MYQDLTFSRASLVSLIGPSLMGGIAAAQAEATLRQALASADAEAGRCLFAYADDWRSAPADDR
jgi:hypothetical protein